MRELREAGLLELVEPDRYLPRLRGFVQSFLAVVEREAPTSEPWAGRAAHVHVGKITGDLVGALCARGLARPSERHEGGSRWLDVEPRTADLYMAYLAATLGSLDDVGMVPLTDRAASLAALTGAGSNGHIRAAARRFRPSVLEKLLPAPSGTVSVDELVRFKSDHARELVAFRLHVERALLEIGQVPEIDAREELAGIVAGQLAAERDELEAAMTRRRWPGIVFGAVAGVLGAVAPLATGHVDPGAVPAIVNAVYSAIGTVQQRPATGGRPLAYAALAQARFQA